MLRLVLFLFCIFISYSSASQSESIEQLINTTLTNHPSIKASRQIIKSAESGVDSAKWGYFPTPSVDFSTKSDRDYTMVRLEQPLWTGGKLDAAYDIATLRKKDSDYFLDENAYRLIESLLQYVQTYQKATQGIIVLSAGKEQLLGLKEMMDRRLEAGVSSKADQELILSRLSSIQGDLDGAYVQQKMARDQIEILSGSSAKEVIVFNEALVQGQKNSLSLLPDEIRSTHPSIKRLETQTKIAEAERDQAKAVLSPNVSLRGEYTNGSLYEDNQPSDTIVYVSVQMSPGAGFSSFSNIQAAEAKILQMEYDKQAKERDLTDAGVRDYSSYQTAQERIKMMDETIRSAQAVFDSYTRLFIAGKRQWLDLVNSSRELTQYKVSLIDYEATRDAAAYQLALKRGQIPIGETK